jgi:hypothetical protein
MKSLLLATAIATVGFATAANATVWTVWDSSYTAGNQTGGSATGALGSVVVTYSGEINSSITNPGCGGICFGYPSWMPTTTWANGIVTTAPAPTDGLIQLIGGSSSGTDTITFSSPVTNPVIAIWSLGQGGLPAEFVFSATPTFEAGGGSAEYGGSAISVSGLTVGGYEGNGSVAFLGSYSSISFTTQLPEDWYGFTVGSAVPEPSTWAMMLLGFAGLGFAGYGRTKKSDATFAAA